jgi:hypothetical protein
VYVWKSFIRLVFWRACFEKKWADGRCKFGGRIGEAAGRSGIGLVCCRACFKQKECVSIHVNGIWNFEKRGMRFNAMSMEFGILLLVKQQTQPFNTI